MLVNFSVTSMIAVVNLNDSTQFRQTSRTSTAHDTLNRSAMLLMAMMILPCRQRVGRNH